MALFTVISMCRLCLSRAHVIAIKSSLLRFQCEATLSRRFGSVGAKTRIAREITPLRARLWRGSERVNAEKTSQVIMVKKSRHLKFDEVRQRFRLTPTEIRVAMI